MSERFLVTKESLGNAFADACHASIRKSALGLRKAAATHAANNGATVAQLAAIFRWSGGQMAALYTKSANRANWQSTHLVSWPESERLCAHPDERWARES